MKPILIAFFVVMIFAGLHTELAITSGGKVVVPFILSGLGAVAIIFLSPEKVSLKLTISFALIGLVLFVMAVITGFRDSDLPQHLIASANFIYSLFIAYATFIGFDVLGIRRSSKLFIAIAVIVVVGSVLELYGGLRPVSDAFRNAFLGFRGLYAADRRDLATFGEIRPRFFAPEPSNVGVTAGSCILMWFLSFVRYGRRRLALAAFLFAIAFIVIRSPSILVFGFLVFLCFSSELGVKRTISHQRLLFLGATTLLVLIVAPLTVPAVTAYGQQGSFFERELAPPLLAAQALRSHPLFGFGIGGHGDWGQIVLSVYSHAGAFSEHPDIFQAALGGSTDARTFVSNGLWKYWIDFGLLGGLAIGAAIWRILGQLSVPNRVLVMCCAVAILTTSATTTSWVLIFSLASLYRDHWVSRGLIESTA